MILADFKARLKFTPYLFVYVTKNKVICYCTKGLDQSIFAPVTDKYLDNVLKIKLLPKNGHVKNGNVHVEQLQEDN